MERPEKVRSRKKVASFIGVGEPCQARYLCYTTHTLAQQALARDCQCIFMGFILIHELGSEALVASWIFPPYTK